MPTTSGATLGTVLVTGGTDGLGRAAAVLLAERGYRVFAGGRNREHRTVLDKIAIERSLPLEALEMDVCDDQSVDAAVSEIEKRAGPVDILVNSAGIAIAAVMEELTMDDLRKQYETNILGLLRTTQRVLPAMRKRRRGRIINMSSISGKVAPPVLGAYSSSKHAVEAISDALRLELYPFDVAVILIEPGYIETSLNRTAAERSSVYAKGAEHSPYRSVYQAFLTNWEKTRKKSKYAPEDCARVILRAIQETPPRARYVVTLNAKLGAFLRRIMSDRAFDRFMRKNLGLEAVREAMEKEHAHEARQQET